MLEMMGPLGAQIVLDYGLIGLFFFSLASASIFVPVSVEITFPVLVMARVDKVVIVLVATAGASFGSLMNYYIGMGGLKLAHNYINVKEIDKARKIMNRYGWIGLFGALILPLPGDPLTVLCGAAKMNLREFIITVTAARIIKYALILGLLTLVI
ncbi:MAG: VTT domain-containing protein [Candidatus Altiarchaeota archaeon]